MKLYDIKKELLDIYSDLVDEETGEIDEENFNWISSSCCYCGHG